MSCTSLFPTDWSFLRLSPVSFSSYLSSEQFVGCPPETATDITNRARPMSTQRTEGRLNFIDNLRILCIALVVLHHLSMSYGAGGDWFYVEGEPDSIFAQIPLILFAATNQAFFMGLLFFISTFFVSSSYNRKGPSRFLGERLIRLGIPTVAYYFLIGPFCGFLSYRLMTDEAVPHSFFHFLKMGWGRSFGPLWFVETLIWFTLAYMLFRLVRNKPFQRWEIAEPMPRPSTVVIFAVFVGLITGLVRTWYPVGRWLPHLNLQLGHFPQYIAAMSLGVVAWQRGWLESLSLRQGIRWFVSTNLFILVIFPVLFIVGGAASGVVDPFLGGWYWQNFGYSIYEQIVGFGLMLGLLGIFKGALSGRGRLITELSESTYAVYIFHVIPVFLVAWSFRHWEFPLLGKFLVLAFPTLVVSFLLGWFIRKLPFASKVL